MKKLITKEGPAGTITGEVQVLLNSCDSLLRLHNNVTHDDTVIRKKVHAVRTFVGESPFESSEKIDSSQLEKTVAMLEQNLTKHLEYLVSDKPDPIIEKLKKLGYA